MSSLRHSDVRWPDPELSIGRQHGTVKGKIRCWEARGPAREAFEQVAPEIIKCLNSVLVPPPTNHIIFYDIYMIGKTQATARPYIMFSSESLKARKSAVAAIKESKIIDRCLPVIYIGDWRHPPWFRTMLTDTGLGDSGSQSSISAHLGENSHSPIGGFSPVESLAGGMARLSSWWLNLIGFFSPPGDGYQRVFYQCVGFSTPPHLDQY